jgi:hypothetical protein
MCNGKLNRTKQWNWTNSWMGRKEEKNREKERERIDCLDPE